jgi:hypothetical protein
MAEIWPVYEGKEPTIGGPWARLPLAEAAALCELRPGDFLSDLSAGPRFGDTDRELWYTGFKHIVVKIEDEEARHAKWRPGHYRSRLTPKETFRRLIQRALVQALGKDNVVRADFEPTIDSEGEGAIKVTVVITPEAIDKLANGAVVDALVLVRERLGEMRVNRTPIIEYATEAELAEDAGR